MLFGFAGGQRLHRRDVEQAAPDGDFRGFAAGIWHRDVQTATHQQSHFGVADIIPLPVRETDSKRLKRPPLQLLFENCVTHRNRSGGGGNRTRVPRYFSASLYVCSRAISPLRPTGPRIDRAPVGSDREQF
jgi:hypothetical protein